ncbi:helicase HerA domain-containing protein [Micromonospora sp. NBC_01813]|uniref:helicase HerA domain-containing protein n=1 Tax=Micromonospora sp. NBC_01813 TaxID=2975988 RepID=UPI002DDC2F15|nr:DUF87 domain-containing protein [Micromonospora sp. NBC_01813]WSA10191.1 DUF87 domain-containing protein [Micromonospora sp. NBC_01813]
MTEEERRALAALRFNWAPTPDDLWRTSGYHVDGLNPGVGQMILDGFAEATDSVDSNPIGVVVQGQRGSGKTHLLGWVREQVQANDGYFLLISLLEAGTFWPSTVQLLLDSLEREGDGPESQLSALLRRLSSLVGLPRTVRRAMAGEVPITRAALDTFVDGLRRHDRQLGRDWQDTARALALRASDNYAARDIANTYLAAEGEAEAGERAEWGMRRAERHPQLIVRDVSRLLALTGPTVIAVDQIDPLIAQSIRSTADVSSVDHAEALMLEQIGGGLMSLRDYTRRTLTVVACLPASWALIQNVAVDTVQDRFREAVNLGLIPTPEVGRALVERRFTVRYQEIGFTPPYPTWPVSPAAFDRQHQFTPRGLLQIIDRHVQGCLRADQVSELTDLAPRALDADAGAGRSARLVRTGTAQELAGLDVRFAHLCQQADPGPALDPRTEDAVMPGLLAAGLTAWIVERGGSGFTLDAPPSAKPALHARLRRTLDERIEDEAHWGFRAVAAGHAVAALNRVRTAATVAGLTERVQKRRLVLIRREPWSKGDVTQQTLAALIRAGGKLLDVSDSDLRTLIALRALLDENPANLQAWLCKQQPASAVELFRVALADAYADPVVTTGPGESAGPAVLSESGGPAESAEAPDLPVAAPAPAAPQAVVASAGESDSAGPVIPLGVSIEGRRPVGIALEALRKHTAIFAGSGSGKTVLIRRLVEECALQGVSAIVLDPNNDLARLGEPWPEPPPHWGPGDAQRSAAYLTGTDVVVWTPRKAAGRPLTFQPLPDLRSVLDDPDEFGEAVDAAVAALAPRANVVASTNKARIGQAVLREALRYFAGRGGSGLAGFVELLSTLPDGVSGLDNADKVGAELAQTLTAAMVNDPLFGGDGVPLAPGLLLTPSPGKRARVSVISFVGLSSDEQRQSFVNQLQMALFAWIKRHPAGDRPLGGLFVMDEAQTLAPSGALTACTQSTLALASQARKYGLGLVFATQAPKALHNRIPGNAATQFFGLLNSPIQIAAAKEMARAKGGDVPDIGRLRSGQFYLAVEGASPEKIQTPLCLSHHPRSPLTSEEVIGRARGALRPQGGLGTVAG